MICFRMVVVIKCKNFCTLLKKNNKHMLQCKDDTAESIGGFLLFSKSKQYFIMTGDFKNGQNNVNLYKL